MRMSDELRTRLRGAVTGRTPVDDREVESIRAFLDAFDALADPLSQEAGPVHVTGSGFVVGPRGVVLLKHKRLGFWLQPGGHIDPGETPWTAAQRECREETGLDVRFAGPFDDSGVPELVHVDVHPGGRGHTHLDLRYLFDAGSDDGGAADPDPPEGESQEIGWFDWDAAIDIADPGLRGALESLRP
jgi:8-oxo-dGTP pyrophosphatase MutT (NUDIX family)